VSHLWLESKKVMLFGVTSANIVTFVIQGYNINPFSMSVLQYV